LLRPPPPSTLFPYTTLFRSHLDGFYYKPRVDKELLEAHHTGLVCLSACASGEVPRLIQNGDREGARKAAAWYRDVFGKENYVIRSEEHTSELQSRGHLVCRL